MAPSISNYKRLNLQLPIPLAQQLETKSQQTGLQKSQLVKKWLREVNKQSFNIKHYHNAGVTTYNLRLPADLYSFVQTQSKKLGVSKSAYLRLVITHNLLVQKSSEPKYTSQQIDEKVEDYWQRGQIAELVSFLEQRFTDLTQEQKKLLSRDYLLLGRYDKSLEVLALVEDDLQRNQDWERQVRKLDVTRGNVFRHRRQLHLADNLLQDALPTINQTDLSLKPVIHSQLGVIADIKDKPREALYHAQIAHKYGKPQTLVAENFKSKLRIASLQAKLGYKDSAKQLVNNVEWGMCRHKSMSLHSQAQLNNRKALVYLRLQDYSNARESLQTAEYLGHLSSKLIESKYSAETWGMLLLAEGNHKEALEKYTWARQLEVEDLLYQYITKAEAYYLALSAKYNYRNARWKLERLLRYQPEPVYQDLGNYLYYSTLFLHGNAAERRLGKRQLQQLHMHAHDNQLLQEAVHNTLQCKRLYPLV